MDVHDVTQASFAATASMILDELNRTLAAVSEEQIAAASQALLTAPRIFVSGAGRSGLAIKMVAMRLMHLGLPVSVVGEVITPPIARGDLLVVASGSGTTKGALAAADTAHGVGADVLAITAAPQSLLASRAKWIVVVPGATKQNHTGNVSSQYAGALFEQALLLTMDIVFQEMWRKSGATAEELYRRHANLE